MRIANESAHSFGDGDFKPLGVTAEPEIKHRIINGKFRYGNPASCSADGSLHTQLEKASTTHTWSS